MSEEELFDPTAEDYSGGGSKYKDLKAPGTYLLGVRDIIKHDKTSNGKLFSRLAFVVLDGPHKGESFTDRVFRSPSSYKRLGFFCKAMGITEKFNPSKGADIERVMRGQALKAEVSVNENNYAELKWPDVDGLNEHESEVVRTWKAEFKAKKKRELDNHSLSGADDFADAPLDDFSDDFGDDVPY